MKTKGITIWERHAERIVLGVAALLAVGFTAMQFVGRPNAVAGGSGSVAPNEVDRLLQQRAEQLLSKLGDNAQPGLELKDPKPALDDLLAQRSRSMSPRETLPRVDYAFSFGKTGPGPGQPVDLVYAVPTLAAPQRVAVRQFTDTLAEGVLEQHPELQKAIAALGAPQDVTFVTARAEFDLGLLRAQFAKLPSPWVNEHPENMLDVVVDRQELVADNWTNDVTLEPIPGQVTVRPRLAEKLDTLARDEILDWLADPGTQLAVIQPDFFALRNGEWDPNWSDTPVVRSEADRLRDRLKGQLADRDRLMAELKALGGTMDEGGAPGAPGGPGAGGDKAPPGGGGPGAPGGGKRPPPGGGGKRPPPGAGGGGFGVGESEKGNQDKDKDPKVIAIKIKAKKDQIRSQDVKIARTKDDLRKLGVDVDKEEQTTTVDPFAVLKADKVQIWAHDLTAQPDRTYRYRLKVRVYNPFFGRRRNLVEAQQSLAENFCIDSPPSEWSKPVTMSPPLRVFITSATAGSSGPGRVTAEVYRFYDGIEWMESFSVAPGGAIGGHKQMKRPGDNALVDVDFTTTLFVLDVVEKIAAGKGNVPEAGGDARVLLHDLRSDRPPVLRDPQVDLKDAELLLLRSKIPREAPAKPA